MSWKNLFCHRSNFPRRKPLELDLQLAAFMYLSMDECKKINLKLAMRVHSTIIVVTFTDK